MCNAGSKTNLNTTGTYAPPAAPVGPGRWALIPFRPRIAEDDDTDADGARRAALARRGRASLRNPLAIRPGGTASGLNIPT